MYRVIKFRRVINRIGRRGAILCVTGMMWTCYGVALYCHPNSDRFTSPSQPEPIYVFDLLQNHWMGFLWSFCGLVAIGCGLLRSRRTVHPRDGIGFNAILIPSILWSLLFLWSEIIYIFTGGVYGNSGAVFGFLVWALVTAFILIIAGWPDPTDPRVVIVRKTE
jgi:hypothetical protein